MSEPASPATRCPFLHTELWRVCRNGHDVAVSDTVVSVFAHAAPPRAFFRTRKCRFGRQGVCFCTRSSSACANTDKKPPIPTLRCPFLHTDLPRVCKYGHEDADSTTGLSVSAHGPTGQGHHIGHLTTKETTVSERVPTSWPSNRDERTKTTSRIILVFKKAAGYFPQFLTHHQGFWTANSSSGTSKSASSSGSASRAKEKSRRSHASRLMPYTSPASPRL